jgi:hypothetical protein
MRITVKHTNNNRHADRQISANIGMPIGKSRHADLHADICRLSSIYFISVPRVE